MNDDFLSEMRRDPDPEFANRLRQRLRRQGEDSEVVLRSRWRPALAMAAALAVIAGVFAFPSVRASAQAMLDLFRVRNFAAVQFDPSKLEKLEHQKDQNNPLLAFGKPEVLKDPGERQVITRAAAESMSSLRVRFPAELPDGLELERVSIEGEGAARLTADVAKLRALLQALDIRDVDVPASIDGQTITVRKPAMVIQEYKNDRRHAVVLQARSPEIDLPAGLDLPRLAEIGMRVLGVEAGQAQRLARSVDWHSTLLVPVPVDASSFRSVEIQGHPGLLVTTTGKSQDGKPGREGTVVMWSDGDQVFAVMGDLRDMSIMTIAESVR